MRIGVDSDGREIYIRHSILIDAIDHGKHTELLIDNGISIVSIYEFIRYKKDMLLNKLLLENSLEVIPIDNPVLLKAGEIFVKLRSKGKRVNESDIYIASSTLANNLKLYAKDRDFLEIKRCVDELKLQFVKD